MRFGVAKRYLLITAGVLGALIAAYAVFWFYTVLWDNSIEINA